MAVTAAVRFPFDVESGGRWKVSGSRVQRRSFSNVGEAE